MPPSRHDRRDLPPFDAEGVELLFTALGHLEHDGPYALLGGLTRAA